ncbi:MAG: HD-GYP domain-containing protein [Candidatus Omnitrophota bacterium]
MYNDTNKQLKQLYDRFSGATKPVHRAYMQSIHALINLTEARDPYTKRHSVKVSNYAVLLAKAINLSKKEVETIRLAAILHDIGKVGIKGKILLKDGSLNSKEFKEVQKHSEIGAEIIKPLKFFGPIVSIIRNHHENYDGTGYPDGLKGEDIPLASRILSIADAYDALTSKRAYREAYPAKGAERIMKKEAGKKFDAALLEKFMDCLHRSGKG